MAECYQLWRIESTSKWIDTLQDALKECPRVFYLSRLQGDKLAVGMYTEDENSMESEIKCFKEVVGSGISAEQIEKLIIPEWEFEEPEEERDSTYCKVIQCPDCSYYEKCLGCPGTKFYKK